MRLGSRGAQTNVQAPRMRKVSNLFSTLRMARDDHRQQTRNALRQFGMSGEDDFLLPRMGRNRDP